MFGRFTKRHRSIPYDMFNHDGYGLAAKNARILERVYHKGNAQTWDGKEVLRSLVETHGKPQLDQQTKEALGRVFAIIMWGELAAWRISAELADEIEPLEAKMAATSQAFDEARHFYVMHDYLTMLGALPDKIHWGARRLLESVMNADHLAKKLLGMQLMVEPVALTLFHVIKKLDVEPVLTHLMPYYERDEARHVALGIQYLPAMLSRMSRRERLELFAFQFELISYEVATNYYVVRDMEVLGLSPRELIDTGKNKQLRALDMVFDSLGVDASGATRFLDRYADTMAELTIPSGPQGMSMRERLSRSLNVLRHGTPVPDEIELVPTITDDQTPLIQSLKNAAIGRGGRSHAA